MSIGIGSRRECRLLKPGQEFVGKQGLTYAVGISAQSVGAEAIHLQILTIPPGGRARAHLHTNQRFMR